MSPLRLAFTPRWLGILGFTLIFAVACVGLGQWQFARRAEARAAIELLNANYDRPTVPLSEVVSDVTERDLGDKWRLVKMEGTYLADEIVYVRTRSGPGGIGFEQLAPLLLKDGTSFIVNRGWVAANADNSTPAQTPTVPANTVTVTVHLMPGEAAIAGRDAPAGQIATINLETLNAQISGGVYTGWYGRLDAETPMADRGAVWSRPILGEGPHLSYALQWYVFALMGFIGYGWALRKEARGDITPKPRVRKRPRDEDIEDAVLDATPTR